MNNNTNIELLSPAGNYKKMLFAFQYGADAVYLGATNFSLRAGANNFTIEELAQAVDYAHSIDKKVYLTINILFHNSHIDEFKTYLDEIKHIKTDGFIMSDIGAIAYVREKYPDVPIHVSTQASITNYEAVRFYEKLGVERVILARELKLNEIKTIRDKTTVELETFIHGAMCIAYSGRCLLSNYFTNQAVYKKNEQRGNMKRPDTRNANLGDCAQSCRWKYSLVEQTRPGEYMPIIEENNATTILSSKDLNLVEQIGELIDAGINSLKIEGRMKSLYYVADVTRVYRYAIDKALAGETADSDFLAELDNISHREYTTGFYFEHNRCTPDDSSNPTTYTENTGYIRKYKFLGYVIEAPDDVQLVDGQYFVRAANQTRQEWHLEIITPMRGNININNFTLIKNGEVVPLVQPNDEYILQCDAMLEVGDIIRKEGF